MQFFQGVYRNKSKLKKVSFLLDIPNTCAIQHCGCGFLLVQSAAAAVRLRDEGEESKAMVMALPASPSLPPSLGGEDGAWERERSRALCTSHLGDEKNETAAAAEGRGRRRRKEEGESDRMVFLSE